MVRLLLLAPFALMSMTDPPPVDAQAEIDASPAAKPAGYARARHPNQTRSVTIAKHGIVATSHPLASQAGLDVLKAGGNAADAAIAANAVLGVVEPMSNGIGGNLFVIYWDAKTQKLYGLNASGRSPYKLNREVFKEKGLTQIPMSGVLSWSVPGCVSGWEALRIRFGSCPRSELLQAAITAAEGGAPVPEVIAGYWRGSQTALRATPEAAATRRNAEIDRGSRSGCFL